MTRSDGRQPDQLRPISFVPNISKQATGSVLSCFGETQVICTVMVEDGVPGWMKQQQVPGGWLTAEYSMLPASTQGRKARDISKGKLDGRSSEIQRLIGRAMRSVVDLSVLGQRTVWIDCDVLSADGGTRTAAITGATVACAMAFNRLVAQRKLFRSPLTKLVAAVSAGMFKGEALLDLNYFEDKDAEVDFNFVMTEGGEFVEIQGAGEESTFTEVEFASLLTLGKKGIKELCELQKAAIRQIDVEPTLNQLGDLADFFKKKMNHIGAQAPLPVRLFGSADHGWLLPYYFPPETGSNRRDACAPDFEYYKSSMPRFTLSERALLLLLAAVQFTHIMDFMIMMPMGPQLMRELAIGPAKFASLVSAYTWSAGLVGLVATAFVDRFDRRPALLVMFAGFVLGTLACALSHSFGELLLARIISGGFGGISGALVMTIVADVVPPARRATGIGIVMTAFSVASALGVPAGLYLAQTFEWETPFVLIAAVGAVMWVIALLGVPPLRGHFSSGPPVARWKAMWALASNRNVQWALLFMSAMVGAHFTIIPFMSPYLVANVGLEEKQLFLVYLTGGILTIFTGPYVGRLADHWGRHRVYTIVTLVASVVVLILTNAPRLELGWVLLLAGFFFMFASGRFVPGQAITSLAVAAPQRGAFMSFSSCVRDLVSGLVSSLGGFIVTRTGTEGPLQHYHWLGWIAVASGIVSLWLARQVKEVA